LNAAREAERVGRHAVAREHYESALRLYRNDPVAAPAELLRRIGCTHHAEGNGEAALDCYIASLAAAEAAGDRAAIAGTLNCLGHVLQAWGRLDQAEAHYRKAARTAGSIGDLRLVATALRGLASLARTRGELDLAAEWLRRALARSRAAGDAAGVARTFADLGAIHAELGDWAAAESNFEECETHAERADDALTLARLANHRTALYIWRGELDRAFASCETAFRLANRLGAQLLLGTVHKNYGIIHRERRRYELAEPHLLKAAEIAERCSSPLLAGAAQQELAHLYRSLDRDRDALLALTYAHRVFRDLRAQRSLADVGERIRELEELYFQVVRRWGESIESKDRYTAGHCERVADYACALARRVGFDEQTLTWFRMGAFLHDVGKVVVPPEILNKEGPLTAEEWEIMRSHTLAGVELLSSLEFPWDLRPMVRSHHEHWDGSGYPDGLSGQMIPLSARILCVADVYDALTSTRAYRPAYSPREALRIMAGDAGRIFDPVLFEIFRELMEERLAAGTAAVQGPGGTGA